MTALSGCFPPFPPNVWSCLPKQSLPLRWAAARRRMHELSRATEPPAPCPAKERFCSLSLFPGASKHNNK